MIKKHKCEKQRHSFLKIFILIIISFLSFNLKQLKAETKVRVLLIPFSIEPESEKKLIKGIQNTIAYKLLSYKKIEIVSKDLLLKSSDLSKSENQKKIIKLGLEQNCSHAIYGSVNVFGKNLSTGAVLLNIYDKKIISSNSEVLNEIDELPEWITSWLEKAINKIDFKKINKNNSISNVKLYGKINEKSLITIDDEIIGMDIADIDNDSINEILIYSPKKITIYNKKMNVLGIQKSSFGRTIKYAKWITSSSPFLVVSETIGENIISTLYEWKDNHFTKINSYKEWFINCLHEDGISKIIGQKRRYSDFWGKVMLMSGLPDKMIPDYEISLPAHANIFNFTFFRIKDQKDELLIKYTPNDKLAVYKKDEQLLWRSGKLFGGSLNFFEVQTNTGEIEDTMRKYIPSEFIICDINNDKTDEIIVCENKSATGRIFDKMRWFSEGLVHVLTWTGAELQTIWTSNKQPGPVTAYALEKQQSVWHLWIICVLKQNTLFSNGYSRMIVYEIR